MSGRADIDLPPSLQIFFCVVALEAVRRLGREYDRRVRAAYYRRESVALAALAKNTGAEIAAAAPFR